MFNSVLVANRGEIAVRIVRACRELGIRTIAVHSDADADALHVRLADESHHIGPAPVRESYLDIERILAAAEASGAEAIDPGYGLLSENAAFAKAVAAAGLAFIGPDADTIATLGDKVAAREVAKRANVPILPGSDGTVSSEDEALQVADEIGYPVVVKASFGGGGRGMRVAEDPGALREALASAAREGGAAFGRSEVYLERHLGSPRHVEVQVLADAHGNVVHVGDRDCTVQRRHQKLVEEAPAHALPDVVREQLRAAAVRLAGEVGYQSTGTVEFLYDPADQAFYFLEMNTRLQVEHGVTELVHGVDLVHERLRVAAGEPLRLSQQDVEARGHAIEVRMTAEVPAEAFRPAPGQVTGLRLPSGPWVRNDFGVEAGDAVPGNYDSMFGKIMAWGADREDARRRLVAALQEFRVTGIPSTAPFLRAVLEHPDFVDGRHSTASLTRDWSIEPEAIADEPEEAAPPAAPGPAPVSREVGIHTLQGVLSITVHGTSQGEDGRAVATAGTRSGRRGRTGVGAASTSQPIAPMNGTVVKVAVTAGDVVEQGATLVVLEAMKMETPITAPWAGEVSEVLVETAQSVVAGQELVTLALPITD